MTKAVVVGGGVAGLLSAILLQRRGVAVTLVEKDLACGGLPNSVTAASGVSFDYGTHYLTDTGVAAVDELLHDWLRPEQWRSFQLIRTGNYFRGGMYSLSPFIDARQLGAADFKAGFAELLATRPFEAAACANLKELFERHAGPTFTRLIHAPILRKQLGAELEDLHPLTPFVLKPLVCADADESRRLKHDPFLDGKIAFATYEEGVKPARHFYPRQGGLGQWVRGLEGSLESAGACVRLGRTVVEVRRRGDIVTEVRLDDCSVLPTDVLVWTIPPFLLLEAAGVAFDSAPVKARPIGLYHMVFDRPFLESNYYVTCFDEALRTFRVTLYPSTRGDAEAPPYNCTAEVIADNASQLEPSSDNVLRELAQMGIISPGARLLHWEMRVVPVGFPATTHGFMAAAEKQTASAGEHLRNTLLLGRAKCLPFFTTDVLIEAHRAIMELPL